MSARNPGKPCAHCWHLKHDHLNDTGSRAEHCRVPGCVKRCTMYVDPDPENRVYRGKRATIRA